MNWKRLISELLVLFCSTLLSLYFLLPNFSQHIAIPDNTDNHLSLSVTVHVARSIATGHWGDLYHFPIYHPLPFTSTAGVNMFGQGLMMAPFWLMGVRSMPFLYNLMLVLAVFLAGLGARRLFSAFEIPFSLALFGAVLLTLHPFKQISYLHLNMIFFFPMLWGLSRLVLYLRESRRSHLLWVAVWLLVQSSFDLSLFFMSTLVLGASGFLGVWMLARDKWRGLVEGGGALFLGAVAVVLLYWPYLKNPLHLHYGRGVFDMMTLIPGYYLFSAWNPLYIGRYQFYNIPLFMGLVGYFMAAYFFWRPIAAHQFEGWAARFWWLLLGLSITVPFALPLMTSASPMALLLVGDLGLLSLMGLLGFAFVKFRRNFSDLERWIGVVVLGMGFVFFRAPYRFLPDQLNPLNRLSLLLPQLSRLRGYRLFYFSFFLLFVVALLGLTRWIKANSRKGWRKYGLVWGLMLFWIFEVFPSKLATGSLVDPRRTELFALADRMAPRAGLLILPHYSGDPYENLYLPHLFDAQRPFYNGYLGVGLSDPLGLYQRGVLAGGVDEIAAQIVSPKVAEALVEGRVLTLVVDRLLALNWDHLPGGAQGEIQRVELWRRWRALVDAFRQAQYLGRLDRVSVQRDGIVAVVKDRLVGERVSYRLGARDLPNEATSQSITVEGEVGTNLTVLIDNAVVEQIRMDRPLFNLVWAYAPPDEFKPMRIVEIRSSAPCAFSGLKLREDE